MAHLALLDEALHRADGVLDRHARIDAVLEVEVDRVDLEPGEALVAGFDHVLRPAVRGRLAVGRTHVAELGRDHRLRAIAVGERAGEQLLILAVGVGIGGIEKIGTGVERLADRGDRLGLVHRPVEAGHRHAPQAQPGDLEPALAETSQLHRFCSFWNGPRVYPYNPPEPWSAAR